MFTTMDIIKEFAFATSMANRLMLRKAGLLCLLLVCYSSRQIHFGN